jgi:hypothetical protein
VCTLVYSRCVYMEDVDAGDRNEDQENPR